MGVAPGRSDASPRSDTRNYPVPLPCLPRMLLSLPRMQLPRLHARPHMQHATAAPARPHAVARPCLLMRMQVRTTHARFTCRTHGDRCALWGLPLHAPASSANVAT
jgi:hypothetical protein